MCESPGMKRLIRAFFVGLALCMAGPAQAQQPVTLELVLALDTSTSVDEAEFDLQRLGLAAAFRHPQVRQAIAGLGPDGLALAVTQWAGAGSATYAVPWVHIRSAADTDTVAAALEAMPRMMQGRTDIATAIRFATSAILTNAFSGTRKTIDVSGDGSSDIADPATARDSALAQGITINGLVIYATDYDLGELADIELHQHYVQRVIGGPGAFVMEARNYGDFAQSIRRKLLREINGPAVAANPVAPFGVPHFAPVSLWRFAPGTAAR